MTASVFIGTSVDGLVIGRKTFETVIAFPEWPYGDKRVVVLSSQPINFSAVRGGRVEQMSGAPAEIVAKLAASGAHHLYIDGGITIQRFLRAPARSAPPPHNHAALSQRLGEERV